MTENLDPIVLNFLYVILGGFLTLLFMKLGCSMFNKIVTFNISDELGKGNIAVGLMVAYHVLMHALTLLGWLKRTPVNVAGEQV